MSSSLERTFMFFWRALAPDLPEPVAEYRIIPDRRWRWDFCWPDQRLAVELQGGIWQYGAHTRPRGVQRDIEKARAATLAGWRVLAFTSDDLDDNPEECIDQVRAVLAQEAAK